MTTTKRDTDYYIDTARRLAELVAANADAVNEQRQIPAHVANARGRGKRLEKVAPNPHARRQRD